MLKSTGRVAPVLFSGLLLSTLAFAHDAPDHPHHGFIPFEIAQATTADTAKTSGQGDLVFRVFKTNRDLPDSAFAGLLDAHGGYDIHE